MTVAPCALWVARDWGRSLCGQEGLGAVAGGRSGEAGRRLQGQRGRAGGRLDALAPQSPDPGAWTWAPSAGDEQPEGGVSFAGRPGVRENLSVLLARFCS